jgi:hypothetical protein
MSARPSARSLANFGPVAGQFFFPKVLLSVWIVRQSSSLPAIKTFPPNQFGSGSRSDAFWPCNSIGEMPCFQTSQLAKNVTCAPEVKSSSAWTLVNVSTLIDSPWAGEVGVVTTRSSKPIWPAAWTEATGPSSVTSADR